MFCLYPASAAFHPDDAVRVVSGDQKKQAIPFQEWLEVSHGGRPALCAAVTLFAAIRGKDEPCAVIRL